LCARLFWGMNVCHKQIYSGITVFANPLEFGAPILLPPVVHSPSIIPCPLPERGVNEHLYRCNWHTKAVMRITTLGDTRPQDDLAPNRSIPCKARKSDFGCRVLVQQALIGITTLTSPSDYFLDCAIPRYNSAFAAAIHRGGQRT